MIHRPPRRRGSRRVLAAVVTLAVLAAAGCSSAGHSADGSGDTINVGFIWPQTGPYVEPGTDVAKGWQFYLDSHGGKLGGHKVRVFQADEGPGRPTMIKAARTLLDGDKVMVLAGTLSSDAILSIQGQVDAHGVALVSTGGRPTTLKDVTYLWQTGWVPGQIGQAIVDNIRTTIKGSVYAIGPDYQGGYDLVNGFVTPYLKSGSQLANPDGKPTWTPWPTTTNFLPYLEKIKASGAKAVWAFYAGSAAVAFIKQYEQAGLKGKIPLYGPGFLTEGSVLAAEGSAADGIQTSLNYAPNLDNAANREFAPAYQLKYRTVPDFYSVDGYDAALVLDRAIAAAGPEPTAQAINDAIGKLGAIDSPRGQWRFGQNHAPIEPWYLRQVQFDGRVRSNVVVQNLATLGS